MGFEQFGKLYHAYRCSSTLARLAHNGMTLHFSLCIMIKGDLEHFITSLHRYSILTLVSRPSNDTGCHK